LRFLKGEVNYTKRQPNGKFYHPDTRDKRKAKMDISPDRIEGQWVYKKIDVRIKDPDDNKQTIKIMDEL